MQKLGFIGMGVMGYQMAGHLKRKGYDVLVFNRSVEKSKTWAAEFGGTYSENEEDLVKNCDVILSCVGNDEDIRGIVHRAMPHVRQGQLFIDHTTTSSKVSEELEAELLKKGANFVDAPVSGGQVGAQNGTLSTMVGAKTDVFERIKPIISCYSQKIMHMGDVGCGQKTKMVNQICIAGVIQGLSEGLAFAEKANLDLEKVIEAISKGAAGSWQIDNRAKTMIADKFDFGFAVEHMFKDLGIVLDYADEIHAKMPITNLIRGFYQQLLEQKCNRLDTSSLIKLLK